MTQHIHTLSAQLHELSLLQELESGVYPFKSEEVALLPLMSNVASLAPLNKKVLYEEANATLTLDKELAFQLSAIILNSAWQLGAKTVQITTDGKAIVFTFDAGDSQVVMSKPKQQLCAQICSVHDGLLTITRNDANAIVTCRLSP